MSRFCCGKQNRELLLTPVDRLDTIGGILGWIFDYVISSFNIFGELSYQFPLMETVVFVLALLVVTGIFSVVAVRYSKRLSLVERIKTMD